MRRDFIWDFDEATQLFTQKSQAMYFPSKEGQNPPFLKAGIFIARLVLRKVNDKVNILFMEDPNKTTSSPDDALVYIKEQQ